MNKELSKIVGFMISVHNLTLFLYVNNGVGKIKFHKYTLFIKHQKLRSNARERGRKNHGMLSGTLQQPQINGDAMCAGSKTRF